MSEKEYQKIPEEKLEAVSGGVNREPPAGAGRKSGPEDHYFGVGSGPEDHYFGVGSGPEDHFFGVGAVPEDHFFNAGSGPKGR